MQMIVAAAVAYLWVSLPSQMHMSKQPEGALLFQARVSSLKINFSLKNN